MDSGAERVQRISSAPESMITPVSWILAQSLSAGHVLPLDNVHSQAPDPIKVARLALGGGKQKHKPVLQSGPGLLLVLGLGFILGQSCF